MPMRRGPMCPKWPSCPSQQCRGIVRLQGSYRGLFGELLAQDNEEGPDNILARLFWRPLPRLVDPPGR